jgi:hypothetical protein
LALAGVAAGLLLAAGTYFVGRGTGATKSINFQGLTFRRGSPGAAHFAPDGRTVVYAAQWEGELPEVFSVRPGAAESRSMGTTAEYGHSGDLFHGTSSGTAGYEAREGGGPKYSVYLRKLDDSARISTDGKTIVYGYNRVVGDLYLLDGLS